MMMQPSIMLLAIAMLVIGGHCAPNIIIIYPDNQDLLLGSNNRTFLPVLNDHIIDQGAFLSNNFVSTPICCPSRAEILTGKYLHNIGPPFPPNGTCMHVDPAYPVFNKDGLFQILHNNGYETGAFGKIMNDMPYWCNYSNHSFIPNIEGFSRLYIPCNYLDYYGNYYFSKYPNGTYDFELTNTSYKSPTMYETSQIGNATINWINQLMIENTENRKKNNNNKNSNKDGDKPFFALWGVHAPHYPATPAYWHQDAFNDTNIYYAPRTPNFNEHYNDRHWLVENAPNLNEEALFYVDQLYRNRLRSMLSVDDFIEALDSLLDYWNIKDNTYVIYVSDNGYHLGQWRIPCDMRNIYDTDVRVPFYIRGPNIESKLNIKEITSNVDIAPTVLELAGIINENNENNFDFFDGKSFAKLLLATRTTESKTNNNNNNLKNKNNNNNIVSNNKQKDTKENGDEWRDMLLLEYIWHDNKTFADYPIWFASNSSFMGENKTPPRIGDNGRTYFTDNSYMSSFRALRILNDTFNIIYAEYINADWTENDLLNPMFYEMYNITDDPWQMNNIYNETSNDMKNYLHNTLIEYASCKGQNCP